MIRLRSQQQAQHHKQGRIPSRRNTDRSDQLALTKAFRLQNTRAMQNWTTCVATPSNVPTMEGEILSRPAHISNVSSFQIMSFESATQWFRPDFASQCRIQMPSLSTSCDEGSVPSSLTGSMFPTSFQDTLNFLPGPLLCLCSFSMSPFHIIDSLKKDSHKWLPKN